jgi:NAD(P)H-nitrite reductase large subunit
LNGRGAAEPERGSRRLNGGADDPIVCRCEEIRRSEIRTAVRAGARNLDEVKRRTRAGMGLCQGRICARIVARIIAEETGADVADIPPASKRQPVIPVSLRVLASGAGNSAVKGRSPEPDSQDGVT